MLDVAESSISYGSDIDKYKIWVTSPIPNHLDMSHAAMVIRSLYLLAYYVQ